MNSSIATALAQGGRLIAGLVAAWQIIGLLPLFTWLKDLSAITANMAATATIKIIILLLFGFIYIFLTRRVRRTMNSPTLTSEATGYAKAPYFPAASAGAVTSRVSKSITPIASLAGVGAQGQPTPKEELLWAEVAAEFEGDNRRPGLWAKLFAEAGGDLNVAKASYLSRRFGELEAQQREIEAEFRQAEAASRREAAAARLTEEAKARISTWSAEACTEALAGHACLVKRLREGEWEVVMPTGVTAYARSLEALQSLAARYTSSTSTEA